MIDIDWNCEALSNIIKNCIEALDEGGKLKLSIQSNALYDEIIIEDNGKGIHKKDLPHLFERFYKGENSSNQSIGIGLALTKKIIENQNGVITVENAYPGAKFIIHYYKENI
jgi:signal transduction histidine kinase